MGTKDFQGKFISLLAATLLLNAACKTARYEFKGNKDKSGADGNNSGADDATAKLPPKLPGENMDDAPMELPPTARVEVVDDGKVVSSTVVNRKVIVTPSKDTLDGDNADGDTAVDPGNCPNPGITEARYDFGDGTSRTVKREPSDCRSLAVEYSWKTVGLYEIKLLVVSDEKEEAQASVSFRVTQNATIPAGQSSSFMVEVVPTMTTPGSTVVATGTCATPTQNRITWDFGDGQSGSGTRVSHQFKNSGQYIVTGLCVDQSGLTLESSTTILVSQKIPQKKPEQKLPPKKPGQTPGQTPGQN